MSSKNKYNKIRLGFSLGIILPLLAFMAYYLLKYSDVELKAYLSYIHEYRILFKIMSLCVLTDLPVFYIFIQNKKLRSTQGVVMAVFIFAFLVLGYRLIFKT